MPHYQTYFGRPINFSLFLQPMLGVGKRRWWWRWTLKKKNFLKWAMNSQETAQKQMFCRWPSIVDYFRNWWQIWKKTCSLTRKLLRYYCFKLKTINYQQKIAEFIVSFSRCKGVSHYRGKNYTEKMVNIFFQVDIKWIKLD